MNASKTPEKAEALLFPFTRKYLGSKRLLRQWISQRIVETAGVPKRFLDGFAGTGSVGLAMAEAGARRIIAVDSLRSNCIILQGFTTESPRAAPIMERLNALPPVEGYVTQSYGGTYFTRENCARMDAIRPEIERLLRAGEISGPEHATLLASFLLAADRVANTLGQYDAFLKNIDGKSIVRGKHLVDERVKTPFFLRPLGPAPAADFEVMEGDMLSLAPRIEADVAYLDPPYNGRQYCDNYHVLENLARWEKPPLFGKTRKFDRSALRSLFSFRSHAANALRAVAERVRSPSVFLSYSSEGILSMDEILAALSSFGSTQVMETPYPVFGNGAGVSVRRSVVEYLFVLRKGG